ncbi:ASCH domain-containing protein [Flavobacterium sp. ZT3R17]|uniref:ASCH domain-containing protein n=1 Tax=Flavobacterium cryoconiti TaxID=3398736 RepID=UPI003A878ACB
MKALSIKQPWASLIAHGFKDIENRTWRTHFRGRIYIHVSAKTAGDFMRLLSNKQLNKVVWELENYKTFETYFEYSAIIGEVEIIDCVINHESIWAEKQPDLTKKPIWNWVLDNPVLYDKPILNVKGKLSFWYPDTDIVECIGCSQKFDIETMEEDDGGEKFCPECWEVLAPIMAQEAKEIRELEK